MGIRWPDGTWGVRVQGVYKARKHNPTDLDRAVGDGRFGFRMRSKPEGMTDKLAFDGKPLHKSSRRNVAHLRKAVCRLAENREQVGRNGWADFERFAAEFLGQRERKADAPRFRARKRQRPVR